MKEIKILPICIILKGLPQQPSDLGHSLQTALLSLTTAKGPEFKSNSRHMRKLQVTSVWLVDIGFIYHVMIQ